MSIETNNTNSSSNSGGSHAYEEAMTAMEISNASINCIIEDVRLGITDAEHIPTGSLFCMCAAIPGTHEIRKTQFSLMQEVRRVTRVRRPVATYTKTSTVPIQLPTMHS